MDRRKLVLAGATALAAATLPATALVTGEESSQHQLTELVTQVTGSGRCLCPVCRGENLGLCPVSAAIENYATATCDNPVPYGDGYCFSQFLTWIDDHWKEDGNHARVRWEQAGVTFIYENAHRGYDDPWFKDKPAAPSFLIVQTLRPLGEKRPAEERLSTQFSRRVLRHWKHTNQLHYRQMYTRDVGLPLEIPALQEVCGA